MGGNSGDGFVVKFVVKCVIKLKNCWIGTKIGVVVDMDPVIMIVVTKRQKGKKTKRKKVKKTKTKKTKQKNYNNNKDRGPKGPPHPPQELEHGGHRPPKF